MSIIEGSVIRLYTKTPFTSISGTLINPDNVVLQYSVQGITTVSYTWVNPTGDPTDIIVNDSTGVFHADVHTTDLAGTWTWGWSCFPSSGEDTTATETAWEGEVTISPSSF